ncbi:hypothetical protein ACFYN9_40615 [Streptomyces collinus]|uniref:hypothetical protein n=1 Tax=Streptomyces collinus TaxID=42684 RepID=UPI0036B8C712
MQSLPVPCPAHLIPDASGTDAFHKAYRQAMADHAVFVAIESDGPRWTVKADTLTAGPRHSVDDTVNDAIRAAISHLVHNREVDADAYTGPIYFMMHSVSSEERARELAAALHAALHEDLEPLHHAIPPTTDRTRKTTDTNRDPTDEEHSSTTRDL